MEKLGFNKAFNTRLPKALKPVMKSSVEERLDDRISKNNVLCSRSFLCIGTLRFNNSEVVVAQKEVMRKKSAYKGKIIWK